MRKLFTLIASLCFTTAIFAIPAMRVWRWHKQADGTIIKVMTVGDEHFNYAVTEDGIPLLPQGDGYVYAQLKGNELLPTTVLAHDKGQRKSREDRVAATLRDVQNLQTMHQRRIMSESFGLGFGELKEGKRKGLVILVQFTDMKFKNPKDVLTLKPRDMDTKTLFTKMMNEKGYTNNNGAIGSVHDYFLDQSDGKFDLTFDVVGPVTLNHPYKYYGERTADDTDARAGQMIIDACTAVKNQVNWADYDWDGDKEVEQVYVLYAGQGEASGGDPNTVWPHKFSIEDAEGKALTFNGIRINTYACSNEIVRARDTNGKDRVFYSGIGTICHEFSHCLGLPDFYDTRGGDNLGTGQYDLMCSGSYNGGPPALVNSRGGSGIGTVPAGYDAYEKAYMGWLKPMVLGDNALIVKEMKGLQEGGKAYFLYNPDNEDEYYVIENRTPHRWDTELPGHGLVVFHVDFDARSWEGNYLNAQAYQRHPRFTIVPADDALNRNSQATDVYPTSMNKSLTRSSAPALSFYTDYPVNDKAGLHNIEKAKDNSISFSFTPLKESTGIGEVTDFRSLQPQATYTIGGLKLNDGKLSRQRLVIIKDEKGVTHKVIR